MAKKKVDPTEIDDDAEPDGTADANADQPEVGAPTHASDGASAEASADASDDASEAEADDEIAALEAKIRELTEENDKLARSSAFYENRRRNADRQVEELRAYGIESFARKIVGVGDSLARALDAASAENAEPEAIREGIEMVIKQLEDALTSEGITPVPGVGEPFDPNVHEALAQQPTADVPPNHVAAEYQRGYRLKDRLLRPAGVIVSVEVVADGAPADSNADSKADS